METTERIRGRRVRFKHPVRVTTMTGEPRALRTLAANLSNEGVFVRMPQPLEPGTRVAIALEAGGRAFPLAEGEVRWARAEGQPAPSEDEESFAGCGVAFTDFLHPRAGELVEYLVGHLETGRPLRTAPVSRRVKVLRGIAVGAGIVLSAALVAFLIEVGTDASESAAQESSTVQVTPVVLPEPSIAAAPVVPAPPGAPAVAAPVVAGPVVAAPVGVAPVVAPSVVATPAVATPAAPGEPALAAQGSPLPDDLAPVALPTGPTAAVATSLKPALAAATKSGSVPAPEPTAGRVALPSGAAKGVAWAPRADGFSLKTELRAGAQVSHVFPLADPPRLVLELTGPLPKKSFGSSPQTGLVTRVRMARQGKYTRVVLDLSAPVRKLVPLGATTLVSF